jgi:fatty acid desaturase
VIAHDEELALARAYEAHSHFEGLTDEQMTAIMKKGRSLFHWFKAHPWLHNTINTVLMAGTLAADGFILLGIPALLLPDDGSASFWTVLGVAALSGSAHSYLLYSLGVFSLHEGAAHNMVIVGHGRLARIGQVIGANICRIGASDPVCYAPAHMGHHAKFGTKDDPEFLNFVLPHRYFLTFLPLAAFINFTDFVAHRPLTFTRSRLLSAAIALPYNFAYLLLMANAYGWLFASLAMFVFLPHVGFYVDRLRQFTEHNMMPLDNRNGSRSFGTGFWGLFVGGGPWGSPCHWEHHLVPSIPWYQQLILHRYVVGLLTPQQRSQFLIEPVVGFPRLWWRLVRQLRAFQLSALR